MAGDVLNLIVNEFGICNESNYGIELLSFWMKLNQNIFQL